MSGKRIGHIAVTVLGLALLLGLTLVLALRWGSLPDRVPAHFDGAGHIDGYSGKNGLIGLLILDWVCWALMAGLSFFPRLWQGKTSGAFRVSGIRIGRQLIQPTPLSLALTGLVLTLMFGYVLWCCMVCRDLGAWFLPLSLVGCVVSLLLPSFLERGV